MQHSELFGIAVGDLVDHVEREVEALGVLELDVLEMARRVLLALDELVAGDLPEDEFKRRLAAAAAGKKFGSSEKFEKFLEERIYDGFAAGATR